MSVLSSLISNKWTAGRNFSRHFLVLLVFTCAVFLLVENDLIRDLYTVYVYKGFNYNSTASPREILMSNPNKTASRGVKSWQYIQAERVNLNITDYQKDFNTSYSSAENTVLLTVYDNIKTDNDSAANTAKASSFNGSKHLHIQLPDPFEIRHDWPNHKRGTLDIFILSAIGANSTAAKGYYKEIELNGWQAGKHKYAAIKCCVLWKSHKISEYYYPNRTHQKKQLSLLGSQIACPIKGSFKEVKSVTLQFAKKVCPENKSEYIRPWIPIAPAKNDSMAICLKILYGDIDDMALIYWIEYYIEMKVDKIFTFTYNIANSTQNILRHYYDLGVVEWREFDYPWKGGRDVGKKVPVFWEDEQVVIYDSFSRLHGYTYFAIIDMDEYLLPRKHENIKDMMKYLLKKHPKGAGFTMKSYLFNKNWEISGTQDGTDMEKYVARTRVFSGVAARPKSILLPSRIEVDSHFHTHSHTPKKGYESVTVNETIAAINHYRTCYYSLRHACNRALAVTDTHILKVIEKIKTRTEWFSKLQDLKR